MNILIVFLLAFVFSFIGTIPPGTLNLTVLQLGLENKIKAAWHFSIAAALVEYPYGWIAVKFEHIITSSPVITENIERVAAGVMILMGLLNLFSLRKKAVIGKVDAKDYGFAKGFILGVLNPLAMPYWIGVTAYLKSQDWLTLQTTSELQAYLAGVCLGAVSLLVVVAYLAKKISVYIRENPVFKYVPAATLLILGFYAFLSSVV